MNLFFLASTAACLTAAAPVAIILLGMARASEEESADGRPAPLLIEERVALGQARPLLLPC